MKASFQTAGKIPEDKDIVGCIVDDLNGSVGSIMPT
jgi:hypothetical protein